MSVIINKSNLSIQLNNFLANINNEISTFKEINVSVLKNNYSHLMQQVFASRRKSYDRLVELSDGNIDVVSPPNNSYSLSEISKSSSGLISALQENNLSKILSIILESESEIRKALIKMKETTSNNAISRIMESEIIIKEKNLSQLGRAVKTNNINQLNLQ